MNELFSHVGIALALIAAAAELVRVELLIMGLRRRLDLHERPADPAEHQRRGKR